jgi:hypothetical protein
MMVPTLVNIAMEQSMSKTRHRPRTRTIRIDGLSSTMVLVISDWLVWNNLQKMASPMLESGLETVHLYSCLPSPVITSMYIIMMSLYYCVFLAFVAVPILSLSTN